MAKRLTFNEVKNRINQKWNNQFIFLDENFEYQNVHQHIKVLCKKCGNESIKRINDLLHDYGCNNCVNLKRLTNDELKNKIVALTNGNYNLISPHYKTRDKATFIHNKCKNTFEMKINNFINLHQRCPFCSRKVKGNKWSKGCEEIKNYCLKNSIKYEIEKCFNECRSKNNRLLFFDFYLPEYNTLIEFDGIQHFQPIDIYGGKDTFDKTVENDNIKNEFIQENNIPLIRINYKDINKINSILNEKLGL